MLMAGPPQSQPDHPRSIALQQWGETGEPSLLQGRSEFAEPAFLNLRLHSLQDRYDPSDPARRQVLGPPGGAVLGVKMAGLHQFIMIDAGRNDFGDCCIVNRMHSR